MRKIILFSAILNLFFLIACSSEQASNTANVNSSNANVPVAKTEDANLAPGNLGDSNINVRANRKLVESNSNAFPGSEKAKPVAVPGAYDSSVSTTMDKEEFVETRTFKSDPVLSKIERRQLAKKFKVYLKNGKVIDVPFDKGSSLFVNGSPQDILNAAGIKPPATPQTPANDVNPDKVKQKANELLKKLP